MNLGDLVRLDVPVFSRWQELMEYDTEYGTVIEFPDVFKNSTDDDYAVPYSQVRVMFPEDCVWVPTKWLTIINNEMNNQKSKG